MQITYDETELDLTVAARRAGSDGVVVLDLEAPDGRALPRWTPGAHIDVELAEGLVRQYSLCGDPADVGRWRVGVLLTPDGLVSPRIHSDLGEGSPVRVRGPRNHFPLVEAEEYLFIAGGIGITPILPMTASVDQAGARWQLTYGGRTRASMAFLDQLQSGFSDHVEFWPEDEKGLIDLAFLDQPRGNTVVYCCGPEPLLRAVEERCSSWPTGSLHTERFAPKPKDSDAIDTKFEVELAKKGLTLTVPADRSILETITDAGIYVPSSCQEGTCGTCETAVLEGIVDHRDSILTDEEQAANDTMFICCSRARSSKLVLDI